MGFVAPEPVEILFEKYREIVEAIPICSMLRKVSQELNGILACVQHGENREKTPVPLKHVASGYYAWFSWRKHTILIEEQLRNDQQFSFQELAMLAYVESANQYIRKLGLLS